MRSYLALRDRSRPPLPIAFGRIFIVIFGRAVMVIFFMGFRVRIMVFFMGIKLKII